MKVYLSIVLLFVIGLSHAQNEKLIGNWVGSDEGEYWRLEFHEDETAVIIFYDDTVKSSIVDGVKITVKYKVSTKKKKTIVKFQLYEGKKKVQEFPCPINWINDRKMIFTFVEDEDEEWDVTMEKLM